MSEKNNNFKKIRQAIGTKAENVLIEQKKLNTTARPWYDFKLGHAIAKGLMTKGISPDSSENKIIKSDSRDRREEVLKKPKDEWTEEDLLVYVAGDKALIVELAKRYLENINDEREKRMALKQYLKSPAQFLLTCYSRDERADRERQAAMEIKLVEKEDEIEQLISDLPLGKMIEIWYHDLQSGIYPSYYVVPNEDRSEFAMVDIDRDVNMFTGINTSERLTLMTNKRGDSFFSRKEIVSEIAKRLLFHSHYKIEVGDIPSQETGIQKKETPKLTPGTQPPV